MEDEPRKKSNKNMMFATIAIGIVAILAFGVIGTGVDNRVVEAQTNEEIMAELEATQIRVDELTAVLQAHDQFLQQHELVLRQHNNFTQSQDQFNMDLVEWAAQTNDRLAALEE